ncbi:MAG: S8 family peptidase [Niabella sp.]
MLPKLRAMATASVWVVVLASCTKTANDKVLFSEQQTSSNKKVEIADVQEESLPGEIIVQFKNDLTQDKKNSIIQKINGKVKGKTKTKRIPGFESEEDILLVQVDGDVQSAISKAKSFSSEIEYAEPNYLYHSTEVSNDPYFTGLALWGMRNAGYGSHADEQWAKGNIGSNTVYVGIIDQGYMYAHDDLKDNAGVNPGEIPDNGIDDDGNGYIDDVYGWDFANGDNTVDDGNEFHGTHVAGTIGAKGGNGIGVAGVVWKVKILSGKFLIGNSGSSFSAVEAIDYFINLKQKQGLNIVALNNSWGGGVDSRSLKNAIRRASRAGIMFIAAAGNNARDNDVYPFYPSNYNLANMISVSSINSSGGLSYFSNYGSRTVDIAAPGESIASTYLLNTYAWFSGTSMATPHVTGAVALYASLHPNDSFRAIKKNILSDGVATPALSGKTITGNRLDVSKF